MWLFSVYLEVGIPTYLQIALGTLPYQNIQIVVTSLQIVILDHVPRFDVTIKVKGDNRKEVTIQTHVNAKCFLVQLPAN